jgi:general secretion pathway protein B
MSYILEALKKAQAERQIGSAPTIHAPTLVNTPAGQGARSKRTPVIVAMALMAIAIAGLAAMLLRQPPAASQPQLATQPSAAQPPLAQPPSATQPGPVPQAQGLAQAPAAQQQSVARPVTEVRPATSPANVAAARSAPVPAVPAAPPERVAAQAGAPGRNGAQSRPAVQALAEQAPVAAQAATQAPAPAPVEEQVQSLRELPEPIQRAIPQITLGGYMYSKNPADRLLLIDKVLRREGEEVAPGLILEKLQPKQAIFGFRGYRYRIAL